MELIKTFLVTSNGKYLLASDGVFLITRERLVPDGGNRLLTTDYIVDMGIPRVPADAQGGPSRDQRGRRIKWE